jgi:hypothetical protein
MKFKNTRACAAVMLGALSAASWSPASAMEGPSVYPMGIANFGTAIVPPPGVYAIESLGHIELDSVRNNSGNAVPVIRNFKTSLDILSNRINWVPGTMLMGGRLVLSAVLPVAHINMTRTIGPNTVAGNKTGTLDLSMNGALGYELAPNLKAAVGLSLYAPTGTYDATSPANLGKNHWAIEPMGALSYVSKVGINADITGGVIFNGKNKATGYTSGSELHFDYAVGWAFGNGWTTGLGGFAVRQISDDKNSAGTVPNFRAAAFAIGPVVKYDSGKGWIVSAEYEKMTDVKNGPKGDIVWLKTGFRF